MFCHKWCHVNPDNDFLMYSCSEPCFMHTGEKREGSTITWQLVIAGVILRGYHCSNYTLPTQTR